MATHAPITGARTRAPIKALPLHRRETIEAEIELHLHRVSLLIARLDRADAPSEDLEDDDPGGTDLDRGEGEGDHGSGLFKTLPIYGLDQSRGPTNERDAERAHMAEVYGLVRSPTGGWKKPH